VAGVMGGQETEIDADTRNILLEAANFQQTSIRRTTQALKLPSEASLRFGRGIHPALAEPAARRASELMRTLAGGTLAQGMIDAYPRPAQTVSIDLAEAEVERMLGMPFAAHEMRGILEALEFRCEPLDGGHLRVAVPEHRLDCQGPADLIEEIARMYGYDRIPVTEMADRLPPQRSHRGLELEEQVRDVLVGCGLQEVVTYSLTSPAREAALQQGKTADEQFVTVANPISPERTVMRRHLLTTVLEVVKANLRFRERLALFEVGKVFLPRPDADLPDEPRRLSIVMAGPREDRCWLAQGGPELDFFDVKGALETLLARLHVAGVVYEPFETPIFQSGRSARLRLGDQVLGWLGELHPAVREAFDLPDRRVAAAEVELEALLERVPPSWVVQPVSAYPAVLQDLAVIVDEGVPAAEVARLISETAGFLLKEVRLFDVYRGTPVPAGKKSLAYALTFQAPDKTLSDEQVAKHVNRLVARLAKEVGAQLRG